MDQDISSAKNGFFYLRGLELSGHDSRSAYIEVLGMVGEADHCYLRLAKYLIKFFEEKRLRELSWIPSLNGYPGPYALDLLNF